MLPCGQDADFVLRIDLISLFCPTLVKARKIGYFG
jgi:hypothetical protein